jgi:hypothetical protein
MESSGKSGIEKRSQNIGEEHRGVATLKDTTEAETRAAEIIARGSTTLMVRNLPNKLTPAMIVECINELGYEGKYDYLFVPIDTNAPGWANRNLGYCFLNLVSADVAFRFCLDAYGCSFRQAISSTKTSKISIAEEQGVLANLRRIARAASNKDHRVPKPNTYPYVSVNGEMAPMAPSAALLALDPDEMDVPTKECSLSALASTEQVRQFPSP